MSPEAPEAREAPKFLNKPLFGTKVSAPILGTWYGAAKTRVLSGAKALRFRLGPLKQWIRIKPGWSVSGDFGTRLTISWGASLVKKGKYLKQIGSPLLQDFNKWLRGLKIPGKSWRLKDPGHFHIWR